MYGFECFIEEHVHTFSFTFIVMNKQPVAIDDCNLDSKSGCQFDHKPKVASLKLECCKITVKMFM